MFTGIIEALARVESVVSEGSNWNCSFKSPVSSELRVDQSVSHNGVCLTVTKVEKDIHWVTVVKETWQKSNWKEIKPGDFVNLERSMLAGGRFDGHIVQGHVDQTAVVESIVDSNGSWIFNFKFDSTLGNVTVEKGSICINGVSLTCYNSSEGVFSVSIIPHTMKKTNFHQLKKGSLVNLEFDILGKYISLLMKKQFQ